MSAVTIKQRILSALSMFWNKLKTTYVTSTSSNAGDNLALAASAGYNLQQQINSANSWSVSSTTVSIGTFGNYQYITAPTVSGKTFVCWLGASTDGWAGSIYILDMGASTTTAWNASAPGSGNIKCFALYRGT